MAPRFEYAHELGFDLTEPQAEDIRRGKDFVQLKSGPFDLVCHPDDIIRSKEAANRVKDRESLPRLRAFRDYWLRRRR